MHKSRRTVWVIAVVILVHLGVGAWWLSGSTREVLSESSNTVKVGMQNNEPKNTAAENQSENQSVRHDSTAAPEQTNGVLTEKSNTKINPKSVSNNTGQKQNNGVASSAEPSETGLSKNETSQLSASVDCSTTIKVSSAGSGMDVVVWVQRTGKTQAKFIRLANQAGTGANYMDEIKSAVSQLQFAQTAEHCNGVELKVRVRIMS